MRRPRLTQRLARVAEIALGLDEAEGDEDGVVELRKSTMATATPWLAMTRPQARYRPSKTHESVCRGNEHTTLRTRPAASSAARPVSPLPALFATMVRSFVPTSSSPSIIAIG